MRYDTLISAEQLAHEQAGALASGLAVFDCSYDLANPDAGRQAYEGGHVPGALYLHLEHVLSAEKTGLNGRHPLPSVETFAHAMAALGVDDDTQVVAYDNAGGMYAARLWWMLRWAGHGAVAVLDGGIAGWRAAGQRVVGSDAATAAVVPFAAAAAASSAASAASGRFSVRPSLVDTMGYDEILRNIDQPEKLVIDARAPDRFQGENETLDKVGGHIPGARNRFFKENLGADGRFKPASQLRAEFDAVTGGRPGNEVVAQCGSGVTACHNLLAMEVAGLKGGFLYPGSWSEYSSRVEAVIASGAG